jgi:hypothetical protein
MYRIAVVLGIIFLFLFSCKEKEDRSRYIISFDKINFVDIQGEVVVKGDDDLSRGGDILIVDSVFICYDYYAQRDIFRVYNIVSFEKVSTFGQIGQGPYDFLHPIEIINKNINHAVDGKFSVFDLNQRRMVELSTSGKEGISLLFTRKMPILLGKRSITQIDDDKFIGADWSMESSGLFFISDLSKDTIKWVSYSTALDKKVDSWNKNILYMAHLGANENKNTIVCALRYFNKVLFYDFDGNLQKEFQIGEEEVVPEIIDDLRVVESTSLVSFADIAITENHIYALMVNSRWNWENREHQQDFSKIFIFNWEKEFVAALHLGYPVDRIAIPSDDLFILGLADDGTGLSDVVKFNLQGLF